MYHFEYQLNSTNIRDMNFYMALHDKKIQTKCLTLSVSISFMFVLVVILLNGFNYGTLFISIGIFAAVLLLFPKIYWKKIFRRVEEKLEEARQIIQYNQVKTDFAENRIHVTDGKQEYEIPYSKITAFDFTKNNCLIFSRNIDSEKQNTLIIPNACMGEEMTGVCTLLKEKTADEEEK